MLSRIPSQRNGLCSAWPVIHEQERCQQPPPSASVTQPRLRSACAKDQQGIASRCDESSPSFNVPRDRVYRRFDQSRPPRKTAPRSPPPAAGVSSRIFALDAPASPPADSAQTHHHQPPPPPAHPLQRAAPTIRPNLHDRQFAFSVSGSPPLFANRPTDFISKILYSRATPDARESNTPVCSNLPHRLRPHRHVRVRIAPVPPQTAAGISRSFVGSDVPPGKLLPRTNSANARNLRPPPDSTTDTES